MAGEIHIGTSGWHYRHWRGNFYPPTMRPQDYLTHYARTFSTVELDGVFYRLPTRKAVTLWRDTAPKSFIFAAKASRFLTHMKKLKDPADPLRRIFHWADVLEDKLGPILFQLPPHWGYNEDRLRTFLQALPSDYRFAIEFREPTWFNNDCYALLEKHGVALCLYDMAGVASPQVLTTAFTYIRFHGPEERYRGSYRSEVLQAWAIRLSAWAKKLKKIYIYFNNDPEGHAPRNAVELRELLRPARSMRSAIDRGILDHTRR